MRGEASSLGGSRESAGPKAGEGVMSAERRSLVVICAVVAIGGLINLITFGVRNTFGLFLQPMTADLGWGRETFALAIALQNLVWGVSQPFVGAIADRYGSGRVLATGGALYALGTGLMAYSSTPWMLHLSAGLFVGLGISAGGFGIVLAGISRIVSERRRSLALGIGMAAGSLGQFFVVPLGQAFMEAYGWGTALLLLAAMVTLVVPLSATFRGRSEHAGGGPEQSIREALTEASLHRGYLLLTAGFFVCGFHVAFIQTHLPAYMVDLGIDARYGAWALALVGLFNVAGSFLAGWLGGHFSKKGLLSLLYLARAVVIAVFIIVPASVTSVLVFASAMGLLWLSTVPLTSGIVAQIFGVRYMATLVGIVFFSHQLGAFLGVWLGGRLYDTTGSYDVVWWAAVALGLAAALVHWPIDERRVPRLAEAG